VKLQYLGDSKDSFKWDYHDFLVSHLGYEMLTVAPMLTADDGGRDGRTPANRYPARKPVLSFCQELCRTRDLDRIRALPRHTAATYRLTLHNAGIAAVDRSEYFAGLDCGRDQVVLVDPDNGFEPETTWGDKHVRYSDVRFILGQVSRKSIVSVFQHFRRVPFPDDFERIKSRLGASSVTALYWQSLMFVAVSQSAAAIHAVRAANGAYANAYPVKILS
jgi:hypothetical protein